MESKKLTFDQIKDGILSYKANSQNKQAAIVIVRGVFESSPTPQVQSGLIAEEKALLKYPVYMTRDYGELNYDMNSSERMRYLEGYMDAEEYAASKFAEEKAKLKHDIIWKLIEEFQEQMADEGLNRETEINERHLSYNDVEALLYTRLDNKDSYGKEWNLESKVAEKEREIERELEDFAKWFNVEQWKGGLGDINKTAFCKGNWKHIVSLYLRSKQHSTT